MNAVPERMSDHWWWRPGVRPGRRVLVWHILCDGNPQVHALAREYQDRLAGFDGLDPVPLEWLHMTTQVVGFADEIDRPSVERLISATARRLRPLQPITVELGRLLFHTEAVVLGVRPSDALTPVHSAVRDAMTETGIAPPAVDDAGWTPHLSVAYSNGDRDARPIYAALTAPPPPEPCPFTVRGVHLVSQERAGHLYRWDPIRTIPLGAEPPPCAQGPVIRP